MTENIVSIHHLHKNLGQMPQNLIFQLVCANWRNVRSDVSYIDVSHQEADECS